MLVDPAEHILTLYTTLFAAHWGKPRAISMCRHISSLENPNAIRHLGNIQTAVGEGSRNLTIACGHHHIASPRHVDIHALDAARVLC